MMSSCRRCLDDVLALISTHYGYLVPQILDVAGQSRRQVPPRTVKM